MNFYQASQSKGLNDLKERLNKLDLGKYGIGVHGVDKGDTDEKKSIAISISNEGLNLNGSKSILGTAISLGTNYETGYLAGEISEYKFGSGKMMSVVIAVPFFIQNGDQKTIFLGFPQRNTVRSGQQYQEHCILDRICGRLRKIPAEFVLGYFYEEDDGTQHFVENLAHYSYLSDVEKELFYDSCYNNMDDISRQFNVLISNGKIRELAVLKTRMQEIGMATYMVDTAILLARQYGLTSKTPEQPSEKGIE